MPPARTATSWAARGTNRSTCSTTRTRSRRSRGTPTHGFRCIKVDRPEDLSASLTAAIESPSRDLRKAKPVSEPVFQAWRSLLYSFDHGDLKVKVESVDDSSPEWRMEKVSYAAAYGGERIPAYLFLPKNAKPPYQVMVVFPGVDVVARALQRHDDRTSTGSTSSCGAAAPSCTRSTRARSSVATASRTDIRT